MKVITLLEVGVKTSREAVSESDSAVLALAVEGCEGVAGVLRSSVPRGVVEDPTEEKPARALIDPREE